MKICSKCEIEKSLAEFNKSSRAKDGRHSYCRDCSKAHYAVNKERHGANVKVVREQYKRDAREILAAALSTGCVDCGIIDLRVLEFDHVSGDKVDGVASMVRKGMSLEKIKAEIEKCVVRCRNHHAIATYERIDHTWHSDYM